MHREPSRGWYEPEIVTTDLAAEQSHRVH